MYPITQNTVSLDDVGLAGTKLQHACEPETTGHLFPAEEGSRVGALATSVDSLGTTGDGMGARGKTPTGDERRSTPQVRPLAGGSMHVLMRAGHFTTQVVQRPPHLSFR